MLIKNSLAALVGVTILGSLCGSPAFARRGDGHEKTESEYIGEGWNRSLYFPFVDRLAKLPNLSAREGQDASCDRFYSKIRQTKQIKVVLGLGYYDDSEGAPFSFKYRDDKGRDLEAKWGMNATVDIAYMTMYASILTRKCSGKLQVCGFKQQSPNVFTKKVKSPDGDKIEVTLEMRNGSLTPKTPDNVGPLRDQQVAKSAETTRWFFEGLKSADLAIYNGHSRKGGGPDFSPPRLLSNLHVNYDGYYIPKAPGLNRLLEALSGPEKPTTLMLMSCNSTKLFSKKIAQVAPNTSFTGTDEVIPGDITTKGALAGIDAVLRFQCEQGFNAEIHATPEIEQHLTPLSFK